MGQKRQTNTKEDIKHALMTLLTEKGFDAITVSDLTRYAKINRGTFYLHYLDKFDLVDQLVREVFKLILGHLEGIDVINPLPTMVMIFQDIQSDFAFIRVLSQHRLDYTNKMLRDFLSALIDKLEPIQHRLTNHPTLPSDYAKEVFLSSNAGIIFHWINKGGIETAEEIAEIFMANNL